MSNGMKLLQKTGDILILYIIGRNFNSWGLYCNINQVVLLLFLSAMNFLKCNRYFRESCKWGITSDFTTCNALMEYIYRKDIWSEAALSAGYVQCKYEHLKYLFPFLTYSVENWPAYMKQKFMEKVEHNRTRSQKRKLISLEAKRYIMHKLRQIRQFQWTISKLVWLNILWMEPFTTKSSKNTNATTISVTLAKVFPIYFKQVIGIDFVSSPGIYNMHFKNLRFSFEINHPNDFQLDWKSTRYSVSIQFWVFGVGRKASFQRFLSHTETM